MTQVVKMSSKTLTFIVITTCIALVLWWLIKRRRDRSSSSGGGGGLFGSSTGGVPFRGSCALNPKCPGCVQENLGWYSPSGTCDECKCCDDMVIVHVEASGPSGGNRCTYCYCKNYPKGTDCNNTTNNACNKGLECAKKDPGSKERVCCDSKTVGTCWGDKYCRYGQREFGEKCIGQGCKMCVKGLECNNGPFESHGTCAYPS